MKMRSKINLLTGLSFVIFGASFIPAIINAAGILSEPINVENARRGQSVWEDLIFMNSSAKEITFELTAEGTIAKWAAFYSKDNSQNPITQLNVPANSNLAAKVKFSIPDNAGNGKYAGTVTGTTLISSAAMSGQNTTQIKQKLDREVNITVTDNQILNFNTIFIPVSYTMAKDAPLQVKVIHENHGNVDISPNIEMRISKNGKEIFKAVFPYPDNMAAIQPNERKEIDDQVIWRTIGYEAGKYDVNLSIFEGDKLNQKEAFVINIGASDPKAASLFAGLGGILGNKNVFLPVLAGIVAIIAVMGIVLAKNKSVFIKK